MNILILYGVVFFALLLCFSLLSSLSYFLVLGSDKKKHAIGNRYLSQDIFLFALCICVHFVLKILLYKKQ